MRSALIGIGFAMALLTPAQAQTLEELDARRQAVVEAWEKMPLTVRRAVFVTGSPELYGAYEERASSIFGPGEPLVTYVEPVGYAWKPIGGNAFSFGVTADFMVKTPEGEILGGQENFLKYEQTSRHRVQELMVILTVTFEDAPPGDYVLAYALRDIHTGERSSFEQPFTITDQ